MKRRHWRREGFAYLPNPSYPRCEPLPKIRGQRCQRCGWGDGNSPHRRRWGCHPAPVRTTNGIDSNVGPIPANGHLGGRGHFWGTCVAKSGGGLSFVVTAAGYAEAFGQEDNGNRLFDWCAPALHALILLPGVQGELDTKIQSDTCHAQRATPTRQATSLPKEWALGWAIPAHKARDPELAISFFRLAGAH